MQAVRFNKRLIAYACSPKFQARSVQLNAFSLTLSLTPSWGRHFRPGGCMFDAIVCDPPYGIRAGARKAGSRKSDVKVVPTDIRVKHIPQTQPYAVEDVLVDLLDLAAQNLRLGGRLVFLLPCTYDFEDNDLPSHPVSYLAHSFDLSLPPLSLFAPSSFVAALSRCARTAPSAFMLLRTASSP